MAPSRWVSWSSSGRETRLLVVTLAVSALLLLVLARFRFPEADPAQPVIITPPLERLAARAPFDELARIMATVDARVSPSMLTAEVQPAGTRPSTDAEVVTRPALRIRDTLALLALQPGEKPLGVGGGPVELVGRDDVRGLAVVQVPSATPSALSVETDDLTSAGPRYVAIVEASQSGPSVRPLFLGRLEAVADVRWGEPLVSFGGALTAQAGTFVFTLDGQLLGLIVADRGLPALVPAPIVLAAADELAKGMSRRQGDFGVRLQRLTPALARAAGAASGVIVAGVDADGPSAALLQPGDVLLEIEGRPVRSRADAEVAMATVQPGSAAAVRLVRGGAPLDATIVAREKPARLPDGAHAALGLVLRSVRGGVEVREVATGTAGEACGLLAGDLITHIDQQPIAQSSSLAGLWSAAEPGKAWLVTIVRNSATSVLALEKQ